MLRNVVRDTKISIAVFLTDFICFTALYRYFEN